MVAQAENFGRKMGVYEGRDVLSIVHERRPQRNLISPAGVSPLLTQSSRL